MHGEVGALRDCAIEAYADCGFRRPAFVSASGGSRPVVTGKFAFPPGVGMHRGARLSLV